MIERIHQKLGTAGFVIAIVALIAALGGTALAAAKLNGTQKKEVEKIAKKYAGKPGAAGPGPGRLEHLEPRAMLELLAALAKTALTERTAPTERTA